MDDILTLLFCEKTQDDYGVWQETYTEREVFCQCHSITRNEFFQAGRNGLNPSFMFTVFQADYEGEVVCRFHDKEYAIYRTFLPAHTDYIELYAERQGGVNGTHTENPGGATTQGN